MLNTRRKLTPVPRRRGRKSLRTSNYRHNRFSYVGRVFLSPSPLHPPTIGHGLTMPRAWQFSTTAGINFRVDFMRALKHQLLSPVAIYFRGWKKREYVCRRERERRKGCFERSDTSCTNFRPISSCNAERAKNSNRVRWENSLHRAQPLIHFVARRDFGVTGKFPEGWGWMQGVHEIPEI